MLFTNKTESSQMECCMYIENEEETEYKVELLEIGMFIDSCFMNKLRLFHVDVEKYLRKAHVCVYKYFIN